jgi:hypothetical protein
MHCNKQMIYPFGLPKSEHTDLFNNHYFLPGISFDVSKQAAAFTSSDAYCCCYGNSI